ncbi:MAG: ATP-grasp domain-containing protein [Patescibacteria group bacterium]
MSLIKVGVLRGGPSSEYDVSLKTGKHILGLLKHPDLAKVYSGTDILIDKKGVWYVNGVPIEPYDALKHVDLVFNAMHGEYGEDGKIQHLLEAFAIPFTGSRAFTSAITMNKAATKDKLREHGIKTPYHKELKLEKTDDLGPIAHNLFRNFPMPVVVKPRGLGSSLGVSHASNFEELLKALDHARLFSNDIIVEEYITGREIVSGIIDDFRGVHPYTMMPVEVSHNDPKQKIFDWASKQSGQVNYRAPALLTHDERKTIDHALKTAHEVLGLRHYATADFIVSPKRGVYLLEINTQPGIHEHAPILHSLKAAAVKEYEFLKHLLKLALG